MFSILQKYFLLFRPRRCPRASKNVLFFSLPLWCHISLSPLSISEPTALQKHLRESRPNGFLASELLACVCFFLPAPSRWGSLDGGTGRRNGPRGNRRSATPDQTLRDALTSLPLIPRLGFSHCAASSSGCWRHLVRGGRDPSRRAVCAPLHFNACSNVAR